MRYFYAVADYKGNFKVDSTGKKAIYETSEQDFIDAKSTYWNKESKDRGNAMEFITCSEEMYMTPTFTRSYKIYNNCQKPQHMHMDVKRCAELKYDSIFPTEKIEKQLKKVRLMLLIK